MSLLIDSLAARRSLHVEWAIFALILMELIVLLLRAQRFGLGRGAIKGVGLRGTGRDRGVEGREFGLRGTGVPVACPFFSS